MFSWQLWLIVAGICLVGEILTAGFLIFWFAIGALLTMLVSFIIPNPIIQCSVFIVTSTLLIFLTKPFVNKFLTKKNQVETNFYSVIGKTGIVTKEINSKVGVGQVKIGGEVWSAIGDNSDQDIIPEGAEVHVLRVDGVKVIVSLLRLPKENSIN